MLKSVFNSGYQWDPGAGSSCTLFIPTLRIQCINLALALFIPSAIYILNQTCRPETSDYTYYSDLLGNQACNANVLCESRHMVVCHVAQENGACMHNMRL